MPAGLTPTDALKRNTGLTGWGALLGLLLVGALLNLVHRHCAGAARADPTDPPRRPPRGGTPAGPAASRTSVTDRHVPGRRRLMTRRPDNMAAQARGRSTRWRWRCSSARASSGRAPTVPLRPRDPSPRSSTWHPRSPRRRPRTRSSPRPATSPATRSNSNFNGGNGSTSSCRQKARLGPAGQRGARRGAAARRQPVLLRRLRRVPAVLRPESWGRVKGITHPAVGNHEYITASASDRTGCDSTNAGAAGLLQLLRRGCRRPGARATTATTSAPGT